MEFRWAEGRYDQLSDLAAELVRLKVDVIVTHGTPGTRAAKKADLHRSPSSWRSAATPLPPAL